jgi:NAD(P)H dehydrogenase (quinone)
MHDHLIAITGSTGQVGSRVATRLAALGARQRLVVRDPQRAPHVAGAEVRVASGYAATDEMRAALDGVHTVFLIPARESANRLAEHLSAVDAIVAAGAERLVYLSWINATPDSIFTLARDHYATEQHIRGTGIPFMFLRMSLYMDFIPTMVGPDGTIAGPAGDGGVAAVLRDDVADCAVAVLYGDGRLGQTHDLTGPEAFTFTEAAEVMTRISGKPIRFHNETIDEAYASRAEYGAPDWVVDGWVTTYSAIRGGELSRVSDGVRVLAGHDPVTLAEYVAASPESLAHVRAPTSG